MLVLIWKKIQNFQCAFLLKISCLFLILHYIMQCIWCWNNNIWRAKKIKNPNRKTQLQQYCNSKFCNLALLAKYYSEFNFIWCYENFLKKSLLMGSPKLIFETFLWLWAFLFSFMCLIWCISGEINFDRFRPALEFLS